MNKEYSKREFWRFLNIKIKRSVHHYKVYSIMSVLFEEIVKDLVEGKTLNIVNFGKLKLKTTNPRKYFNFVLGKTATCEKHKRILRFTLEKKIKLKLISLLDLDKSKEDVNDKKE